MGKIGYGYDSEGHLLRYLGHHRRLFSQKVAAALGAESIRWLDFQFSQRRAPLQDDREFKGVEFLKNNSQILERWSKFWPQNGNCQNWDAVGKRVIKGKEAWVLVEAKAHLPEMESHFGAKSGRSKEQIRLAFEELMTHLGIVGQPVENWFEWYYQFANRLAVIYFSEREGIEAHLVNVHFCGEKERPGWRCPQNAAEWEASIKAMKAWLGVDGDSEMMSEFIMYFWM